MSWVITGITVGATAGGLGGYFGTSKKNKKDRGSNALKYALIGGTLGGGAGAFAPGMMGGGAAAGSGAAGGAGAEFLGGASAAGGGVGTSAPAIAGTAAPSAGGSIGFMKGLMYNDPSGNQLMQGAKSMMTNQMLSGVMGGGQQNGSVQTPDNVTPGQAFTPINAGSIPIGMQSQLSGMSELEKQKLLMSLMQGGG